MSPRAPHWLLEFFVVISIFALAAWAWPDLTTWYAGRVQTSALGGCQFDVNHEQLHIVIVRRGDRLLVECMYVGSRGTYGQRKSK